MNLRNLGNNQTEVTCIDGTRILFSYSTPVAFEIAGTFCKTDKFWSPTTSRHIKKWIPEGVSVWKVPHSSVVSIAETADRNKIEIWRDCPCACGERFCDTLMLANHMDMCHREEKI